MNKAATHINAFDLIRSSVILIVFFHHIISQEQVGPVVKSITPALGIIGMSLLGFISATLLSRRISDYGGFLLRRLSRIFIPLFLCLTTYLILYARIGELDITQHTLLHYMGLTGFFKLFGVVSDTQISGGLWFITTIILLYLTLPIFESLLSHKNATFHLLLFVAAIALLDIKMYGQENAFNVATGFILGIFLQKTERFQSVSSIKPVVYIPVAFFLLLMNFMSIYEVFPFYVHRLLYFLYPIFFIPLFFDVSNCIPNKIKLVITAFAAISYEFYILHFYFIDNELYSDIWTPSGIFEKIIISFLVTIIFSVILSKFSDFMRKQLDIYLFNSYSVVTFSAKKSEEKEQVRQESLQKVRLKE